jgi:hypothetical protein
MNPMVHLKHAWDNTHTVWGKMTIVLFYIFIWLVIISSFIVVIKPEWMGIGCFLQKESEYGSATIESMVRQANWYAIGFYLYADRGGIRLWNVTMVFVVTMIGLWFQLSWAKNWATMEGAPKHCDDGNMTAWTIAGMVWIGLAWVFSFLEHRAAHAGGSAGGTTNESTPLTA